jgi:hypothetical protein
VSRDLTNLEAQLKIKMPYLLSVAWADESAYLLRLKLRKPTWHDTLVCLLYVSEELLIAPEIVAMIIEKQVLSEVRSAAARYGWQRRKARASAIA